MGQVSLNRLWQASAAGHETDLSVSSHHAPKGFGGGTFTIIWGTRRAARERAPVRETEVMPSRDSHTTVGKRRSSVPAADPRPPTDLSESRPEWSRPAPRAVVKRLLTLLLAGVVLYGVAPAVLEVLGAYKRLTDVDPAWWIAVIATSAAGIWCMCGLQRLLLQRPPWFPTVTSQLAGTAFSKVVPGGAAAAAALQAQMLGQAGVPPTTIGTGLTAGGVLLLTALAGLPLLALPAVLLGRHIPDGLVQATAIGLAVFLVLFAVSALLLFQDALLRTLARALSLLQRLLRRRSAASDDLGARVFAERDLLRQRLGDSWPQAMATAAGRWLFDFLCLYSALLAVGSRPPLYIALLAYCAAQLLGQLPLTPGGLGVVEAGLTGTLALAGVAAAPAALAVLAYRLAAYWLPLPVGLVAWVWHRHRYGTTRT